MYKYETHLHTFPVSRCASASVYDSLMFYKSLSYDGVFITNHFIDSNININTDMTYEERINFFFSDYEHAKELEDKIGIKVFCGVEMSYKGTDFLVYGPDKQFYLDNPQIMDMKKTDELEFLKSAGALIIQAHPYREAEYINHIRLFPRSVHGVETVNASRTDFENKMADIYADSYGLLKFAGSDNHAGADAKKLSGMCIDTQITSEADFVKQVKENMMHIFTLDIKTD